MIQTLLHGVISAVVEAHLGGRDCDGALASDLGGQLDGIFEALRWRLANLRQKSFLMCLFGREEPRGVGQLSGPAVVAYDFLEPLQSANISSQPDINFLDCELSAFGGDSDIGRRS